MNYCQRLAETKQASVSEMASVVVLPRKDTAFNACVGTRSYEDQVNGEVASSSLPLKLGEEGGQGEVVRGGDAERGPILYDDAVQGLVFQRSRIARSLRPPRFA